MKKLLTILLTLLMIFTLVGCNSSSIEEQPVSKEDQPTTEVETPKEEDIVGGYTDVEDKTVTDELKQLFDSALEGFLGATYEPLELVATQVVAGTNYKFKASGTKTTNPVTKGTYYITIYKDLQGNVSLLDIEVIEETQEEAKEETIKLDSKDLSNVSFWVVFYNPDGSELYRTTLKYGQTPIYKGSTPSYWDSDYWYKFVCWTDKQGNEIKEFKPITGNTYIYAKYEIGGDYKKKTISSIPAPACSNTNHLLYINDVIAPNEVYCDVFYSGYFDDSPDEFNKLITGDTSNLPSIDGWYHCADLSAGVPVLVECTDPDHHGAVPCFPAGTQVQYDLLGNTKNIEDFIVGDQIVSYNVNTNEYYLAKVGKIYIHDGIDKTNKLVDVTLEDGSVITMTPSHPVLTTAGFRAIDNDHRPKLEAGQFVMRSSGWTKVRGIKVYECKPTVTYNLGLIDYDEIVDNDTYDTYVASGIVVHNIK